MLPRKPTPSLRGAKAGLLLAVSLVQAAGSTGSAPLRILISPPTQWGWVRDSATDSVRQRGLAVRRAQLDYFRSLGFTHATYGLDPDMYNHWVRDSGKWVYAPGRTTGADSSLAAARRDAEKRGMRLIPQLASLSHMDPFITWVDSSISEFADRGEFRRFLAASGYRDPPGHLNHVAAVGTNPAADQFFEGQLGIIRRAWRDDPAGGPEYIHIGHDELGFDSACFIKAGRSRGSPRSRSELVAEEINARVSQISRLLGGSVRVILYGDSFLPTDLGERYGLAGHAETGEGGVLWYLRHRYRLEKRLLVMPWNYILEDGDRHYWSGFKYDKGRQIRYLERLGFGYLPGVGEHGSGGDPGADRLAPPFSLGWPGKSAKCLLEWVEAARRHPRMLRGYAYQIYEPYDFCSPDGLCAGFNAPLLAYAGWTYPESRVRAPALPPGKLLDGVDARRSRKEGRWIKGVHFPGP